MLINFLFNKLILLFSSDCLSISLRNDLNYSSWMFGTYIINNTYDFLHSLFQTRIQFMTEDALTNDPIIRSMIGVSLRVICFIFMDILIVFKSLKIYKVCSDFSSVTSMHNFIEENIKLIRSLLLWKYYCTKIQR